MSDFEDIILQLKADSLQVLNLWNNPLMKKESDVIVFAEALKTNTSLQKLNLGYNIIGDSGAIIIAEALKINTTLEELSLGYNSIGDQGAIAFAEALKINTTLQELILWSNIIGIRGAIALTEAFKVNTTLQGLNLDCNNISFEEKITIYAFLNRNKLINLDTINKIKIYYLLNNKINMRLFRAIFNKS